MKTDLYNQEGEVIQKIEIPDKIFNISINQDLIHQAVLAQDANSRLSLAHAKDRSEVRGGGKKPWRQKGTGRARHGSIRSPIWVGGGVTHGPLKSKIFQKKINKIMKRNALLMALSSKVKDSQVLFVDKLSPKDYKTKQLVSILNRLSSKLQNYKKTKIKQDSILILSNGQDKNLNIASKNIPYLLNLRSDSLNIKDVLVNKYLIVLEEAIPTIEKMYLR
ncbi:MAG: 50S ribosomal protein L4 [Parcubacteria group bacterium]|nr:50S ribosomal protein L4 [Parcubacteria group bacterium]